MKQCCITILFSWRLCVCWFQLFCVFFKHFAKMAKFGWNVKSITRRFSPILDIHIIRMCSWLWVNWCNWFCCIMFDCWVIHHAYYANHTCYDKIIYTILFSSKWWVYSDMNCLVFFCTLWKRQYFDKTPSL